MCNSVVFFMKAVKHRVNPKISVACQLQESQVLGYLSYHFPINSLSWSATQIHDLDLVVKFGNETHYAWFINRCDHD